MLFWLSLSIVVILSLVAIAVFVAMSRAERRARDAFYASLGYSPEALAGLKGPKGAVGAQLARLRATADGNSHAVGSRRPSASD